MLRQPVKMIDGGNIVDVSPKSAKILEDTGQGYIVGEPYEFPKVTPAPVIEEEVDE